MATTVSGAKAAAELKGAPKTGDAALATQFADAMLQNGVYVIGFSYPVVPQGRARIRTQISAAHSRPDLDLAVQAFGKVKKQSGI